MLVKNTATWPVCLDTGRVLAPGETGGADPDANRDAITCGHLTPVQAPPKNTKTKIAEES